MRHHWPTPVLTLACLAGLGLAGMLFAQGHSWLFWLGLALAASAPLGFVLLGRHKQPAHGHPVMVSVLLGLGCVFTLVGVQRFGDNFQWVTGTTLALLIVWMLYQRYHLRQQRRPLSR